MSTHADGDTPGTLLQGSDGTVYFIPHDRLGEFQVADEDSVGVREALGELDDDVAGFRFQGNELKQGPPLKQGVFQVKAFEGPIGIRGPVVKGASNTGDGIWGG